MCWWLAVKTNWGLKKKISRFFLNCSISSFLRARAGYSSDAECRFGEYLLFFKSAAGTVRVCQCGFGFSGNRHDSGFYIRVCKYIGVFRMLSSLLGSSSSSPPSSSSSGPVLAVSRAQVSSGVPLGLPLRVKYVVPSSHASAVVIHVLLWFFSFFFLFLFLFLLLLVCLFVRLAGVCGSVCIARAALCRCFRRCAARLWRACWSCPLRPTASREPSTSSRCARESSGPSSPPTPPAKRSSSSQKKNKNRKKKRLLLLLLLLLQSPLCLQSPL